MLIKTKLIALAICISLLYFPLAEGMKPKEKAKETSPLLTSEHNQLAGWPIVEISQKDLIKNKKFKQLIEFLQAHKPTEILISKKSLFKKRAVIIKMDDGRQGECVEFLKEIREEAKVQQCCKFTPTVSTLCYGGATLVSFSTFFIIFFSTIMWDAPGYGPYIAYILLANLECLGLLFLSFGGFICCVNSQELFKTFLSKLETNTPPEGVTIEVKRT